MGCEVEVKGHHGSSANRHGIEAKHVL